MAQRKAAPLVGVVMGSDSDWDMMKHAAAQLDAFGIAYEAARAVGAPDARRDVRVRRRRGAARAARDHRRRRRRRASARHARGEDDGAGARRAGAVEIPARRGFAAVDRADARRAFRSRRSRSARPAPPTPRCSPSRCSPAPIRRWRASSPRFALKQTTARARCACRRSRERRHLAAARRGASGQRSRPAHGSACSAAASSAACSAWRRRAWAIASLVLDPGERQPGRQRRRPAYPRRLPRSAGARGAARRCARGDDRIRERAGRGARIPGARIARDAGAPRAWRSRRTAISEKTFLAGSGFARRAVRRARNARRRRERSTRAAARHRQERAPRLRRQGPGPRADARRVAPRSTRCAAAVRARAA